MDTTIGPVKFRCISSSIFWLEIRICQHIVIKYSNRNFTQLTATNCFFGGVKPNPTNFSSAAKQNPVPGILAPCRGRVKLTEIRKINYITKCVLLITHYLFVLIMCCVSLEIRPRTRLSLTPDQFAVTVPFAVAFRIIRIV